MHVVYRKTCRACGSPALTKVIDLGEQFLQGSFVKPGKEMPPMRKIPTSLVRCDPTRDENACGLLQLALTLPPEILYSSYWYHSGTNRTMRDHLREIAEEAAAIVDRRDAWVLDIGCNDGTLLGYYPQGFTKFGIDPSDAVQDIKGNVTVVQDIFPSAELVKESAGHPFDIITSIAMFYDLEDPVGFVRQIKQHLAPEGLWVFEMSYMPSMLKMNSYDTICHEHLEYYSLAVLEYILRKCDMKMVKVTLNDINGGSIRCQATHTGNFAFKKHEDAYSLRTLRKEEFDMELDSDKPYRNFQERVDAHKRELSALLKELRRQGKRIHVYGASTKGNTILQFCGIDNSIIDFAADRNPRKHGARTLGTDIPIISEAESRAMNPDYYLVLPWHFKGEFLEREREALDRGIGMIFPFPTIEIIKR
ncbi:MAG: class I SAM-dependent methyltransferase [Candidatus Rokubacteria bacterium]|nr:class I SAM-dependent methyltransferase [Candidatus Rokubacteria bacterium]